MQVQVRLQMKSRARELVFLSLEMDSVQRTLRSVETLIVQRPVLEEAEIRAATLDVWVQSSAVDQSAGPNDGNWTAR